jgi:putative transposase
MVDWPHAPLHRIDDSGAYFITAGTLQKEYHFRHPGRLDYLRDLLFDCASRFNLSLQAWAIFPNHYHFVAVTPRERSVLRRMITTLHKESALHINKVDGTPGRTADAKRLTAQHSSLSTHCSCSSPIL